MLTRVDDDLHARVKQHAADIGTSMNDVVIAALERELAVMDDPRQRLRARAVALGIAVEPAGRKMDPRERDELIASLRGAGPALIEGLEWARGPKP